MLGDYSEFENICKVLVCNELVKSNYGICLIVFQQVSHLSCAPAVTDDDHADKDIMKRKPIDPDQGMFTKHFTTRVIIQSLIIGLTTLAAYILFKLAPMTSGQWWTVIGLSFGVLALSELFKLFTRKKGR